MQSTSASFAVGLNCPVSMELIVLRETPTSSASWLWDSFRSARASLRRFLKISVSSNSSPPYRMVDEAIRW